LICIGFGIVIATLLSVDALMTIGVSFILLGTVIHIVARRPISGPIEINLNTGRKENT